MVYQYVISSYINIFHFQLNIYYTPFKTVCDICHKKNNFLAGEIFRIFFLVKAIFNVNTNRKKIWTNISILRFCGANVHFLKIVPC